jgi:hypothetical protein
MPTKRPVVEKTLENIKREMLAREAYLERSSVKKEDFPKDATYKSLNSQRKALVNRLRAIKQIEETNAAVATAKSAGDEATE